MTKKWDPRRHPRQPSGAPSHTGGEFTSVGGSTSGSTITVTARATGFTPSSPSRPTGKQISFPFTRSAYEVAFPPSAAQRGQGPVEAVPSNLPEDRKYLVTESIAHKPNFLGHNNINKVFWGWLGARRAVFKPEHGLSEGPRKNIPGKTDLEREMAAWEVNQIVNLVDMPVPAIRDLQEAKGADDVPMGRTLVMNFREGVPIGQHWHKAKMAEIRKMALFDAIIGNEDRHGGNVHLVEPTGHIIAIDHGTSFPFVNRGSDRRLGPWGNYGALKRVDSPVLTNEDVEVLRKLRKAKPQLDLVLNKYIGVETIHAMWRRVDQMMRTGRLPVPTVNDHHLHWVDERHKREPPSFGRPYRES